MNAGNRWHNRMHVNISDNESEYSIRWLTSCNRNNEYRTMSRRSQNDRDVKPYLLYYCHCIAKSTAASFMPFNHWTSILLTMLFRLRMNVEAYARENCCEISHILSGMPLIDLELSTKLQLSFHCNISFNSFQLAIDSPQKMCNIRMEEIWCQLAICS